VWRNADETLSNSRRPRYFALSFPSDCTQHAKALRQIWPGSLRPRQLLPNHLPHAARHSVIWFGSIPSLLAREVHGNQTRSIMRLNQSRQGRKSVAFCPIVPNYPLRLLQSLVNLKTCSGIQFQAVPGRRASESYE
jgi:hypothetical protein